MLDISSEPRNLILLGDIYNEMKEIEIDKELLLLSVEEPTSTVRVAMKNELSSIEKKLLGVN